MALKGNQGTLRGEVVNYFYWAQRQKSGAVKLSEAQTLEKGHGRIEERRVVATEDIE